MRSLLPQSFGWYGKLPSRGDFVGRGLPRAWLRTWDGWLQRALAASAQQLGTATLRERLLTMPAWQCLVLPQRRGEPVWCGVVAPSHDRVGRVFPLLLAEAFEAQALGSVDLGELRARGLRLSRWLADALANDSPKELDAGAATLGTTPLECPGLDDTRPGADVDALRQSWPEARSFWWRAEPAGDAPSPWVDVWPPREALMLHLLDAADAWPADAGPR